jgi:hypothetical protein
VDSVPEIPYPSCGGGALPAGEVIAEGRLRPGPTSLEKSVVERFDVRRRACLVVATVRQEWPLSAADVEVVGDAATAALAALRPFVGVLVTGRVPGRIAGRSLVARTGWGYWCSPGLHRLHALVQGGESAGFRKQAVGQRA